MFYQLSKRRCPWPAAVLFLAAAANGLLAQMLYVGNNGDDTISAYVIDQDSGLLTEVLPRVSTPGAPTSVVVHPSGKFVYVTNSGNANLGANGPSLAAFSIDPATGALTLVNTTPLTPGTGPQGAAIDPAGKFVFVAHQGGNNISVFSLDPSTGAPSPVSGSPFASPAGPHKVVVHPNGKFAYVAATGAGQIAVFSIGADGTLTPAAGSPFAARNNLNWMTMDAAGKFLFAAESQQNGVLVYSVDSATGALTLVTGSPFSTSGFIQGVAVDPAGKFLYATNGGGTLHGFRIGATGALTPIPPGFFPSQIGSPFDLILDPAGKFVYVTSLQNNQVAAWSIDSSSGALTPIPVPPYPTGAAPQRGASILLSPPVIPPIIADSAVNAFSNALPGLPNAGIAQGSLLFISGKNIGPAVEAQSPSSLNDFPLGSQLGGVSIQIQSGGVTTAAIMRDVTNNQVAGIVPSTTPLGPATVTVTYKGRTTTPVPITIVTTSAGLETLHDGGNGPARRALNATPDTVLSLDTAVNPGLPVNALNLSAKPGQRMVIRATGLGPVTIDETQPLTQELNVPVDVIIGNKLATVVAELRVVGVDYILIQLPDDAPQGCYVPLAVRAGGVTSNVASISISATGASCSDATGLSASDIDAAQKSGNINMATIVISHIDFGQLGGDSANGIFARYDFNSLLGAFSPGNNGSGIRSAFGTPPLGTCTVSVGAPTKPNNPFDLPSDNIPQYLNVGQALNLNGPQGTVKLPAPDYAFNPDGNVITPGDYTVDNGTGTQAFGPFKAVLSMPPMLTWTNKDALSSLDRTQDLTVTWSGGLPDKEFALIVGLSANKQATTGFLCAEKVSAGQFTVPAWVLSSLPASATFTNGNQVVPSGLIGVGSAPLTNVGRFSAPGFDFGVFTYEQATATFASYQ
jgi:6-phosphogluconolactonase